MADFHVWAPKAQFVELALPGESVPMAAGQDGWWHVAVSGGWPGPALRLLPGWRRTHAGPVFRLAASGRTRPVALRGPRLLRVA